MHCLLFALSIAAAAPAASSTSASIYVDAGWDHYFVGDGYNGYGANIYPGISTEIGLVPEIQFGVHRYSTSASTDSGSASASAGALLLPLNIGLRWELAKTVHSPVEPFIAAHAGFTFGKADASASLGDASISKETDWYHRFGFNAGGGVNAGINDNVGAGVAVWYNQVFSDSDDSSSETLKSLFVGANLRLNII